MGLEGPSASGSVKGILAAAPQSAMGNEVTWFRLSTGVVVSTT